MILTLIFLAAIGVIVLAERSVEHLPFAIAALAFNVAVLLFIVADFDRAILLACVLAAAITAASTVKYNHSALKLIVTDLPLVFAGTVPFFIVQYPRAVLAVLAGSAALMFGAVAAVIYGAGSPIPLEVRFSLFSLTLACVAATYRISGGADVVPADRGPAAVPLLDLHGLADRSPFLAAIRRVSAERYRK